ncbi:hypothetical protein [Mycolicibacterium sp. A43C]
MTDRLDGRCDFAVLGSYLRHFAGRRAMGCHLSSTCRDFPHETWKRFTEAMHLHGVDVGDLRTVGITIDNINGQVERVR